MKFFLFLSIVFISASEGKFTYDAFQSNRCRSPDQDVGLCVTLPNCPYIVNLETQHGNTDDLIRFKKLAELSCGNRMLQNEKLICCSKPIGSASFPTVITDPVSLGSRTSVSQNENEKLNEEGHSSKNDQVSSTQFPMKNLIQSQILSSGGPPMKSITLGTPVLLETSSSKSSLELGLASSSPTPASLETTSLTFQDPLLELGFASSSSTPASLETTSLTFQDPLLESGFTSSSPTPASLETTSLTFQDPFLKSSTVQTAEVIQPEEGKCIDTNGKPGYCISLLLCPPLLSHLLANPTDEAFKEVLRKSNKKCDARPPVICCPSADEKQNVPENSVKDTRKMEKASQNKDRFRPRILTPQEGCGTFKLDIKASVSSSTHEAWPWLALLGYKEGKNISFLCGGTLITMRHVLTAAHCIKDNLQIVRLGEYDLSKITESEHQDIGIARISKHPDFDGSKNDISVLHLSQDVEFSDKIRSACIPDRIKYEGTSFVGFHPVVAGWRKSPGELSNTPRKVQISIYENNMCQKRFLVRNQVKLDERIICAGELSTNNDTCFGDPGGPLMLPDALDVNNIFFDVIGIESYSRKCGDEQVPGIYTNVIFYSNWIKEKVIEET